MADSVADAAPPAGTGDGPATVLAGDRLDRLPASRWLGGVMAVLFLGWLVESYDIGLIGSVLPSLTHLYHLSTATKSLVATASTIGIVVGILPAGWLADRFGRKRVLVWGTVAYGVLSFTTGLADGVGGIVLLRLLSGLAMGAVFPIPYVYGSELCPAQIRGRFTGFADSFLSIGYFLSPLLAAFLIPSVHNATGWRTMFFIGGLPVLFAVVAWRALPESPRWYEARGRLSDSEATLRAIEQKVEREVGPLPAPVASTRYQPQRKGKHELRTLFTPAFFRRTLVLWVTFGGLFFVFYSIQVFMPTAVNSMGFNLTSAFIFTSIIVAVSIPGKLAEAFLVERFGRKAVIIGFGTAAGLAAMGFAVVRGAAGVLLVGCAMSLFGIGVDPAVKVYTAESYPTALRATGTAATEGFGRLLSGIVGPALVPLLLAIGGVTLVFVVVGAVALLAVVTVALFGEETKGQTLEAIAERRTPVRHRRNLALHQV